MIARLMYFAMNKKADDASPFTLMMKSIMWMGKTDKAHHVILPEALEGHIGTFKKLLEAERLRGQKEAADAQKA